MYSVVFLTCLTFFWFQASTVSAHPKCNICIKNMATTHTNTPLLSFPSVPVCPHAGGVGLCELVQHLILFDYICVSGSLSNRYEQDLFLSPVKELSTEADWQIIISIFFFSSSRMCEYVDHLHEHFTSPVLIRDAHYVPPKVR